jgi:oxygen-independent coproporphyrinogen-3 oxidase
MTKSLNHQITSSLYIHWPFCESKCPYCDFNSHVTDRVEYQRWLTGYLKAIDFYSEKLETRNWKLEIRNIDNKEFQLPVSSFQFPKKISSIFFGGGTPSLMKPEMVFEIIQKAKKKFEIADDIEITLEANPSSFETEKFKAFKDAGINRVSIGVQSFDEAALKFLGRKHDKNQAIHAIEQAGKIFGNFSFDLIYALPKQTLESWQKELDFALQFNTPHLSLYQLTIEKGTPFYADFHKGKFKLPEEDLQTDLYIETVEKCAKAGLERYEISNFAKPAYESQHNMNYWLQNDYIGIGPGAHGRLSKLEVGSWKLEEKKHQTSNFKLPTKIATMDIHHPENWLKAVEENGHGIQSTEILSPQEIFEELIFMGLRIKEGISWSKFEVGSLKLEEKNEEKKHQTYNIKLPTLLKKLCDEGLMIIDENSMKLTKEGMLLHTSIVKKIIEAKAI